MAVGDPGTDFALGTTGASHYTSAKIYLMERNRGIGGLKEDMQNVQNPESDTSQAPSHYRLPVSSIQQLPSAHTMSSIHCSFEEDKGCYP